MIRALPPLTDLLSTADLPPALGPFADGLVPLLEDLRYDGLRWYTAPDGDAGRIELTIVSWQPLGIALGGADGVALVLQPDRTYGESSAVRVALRWRWPVLALVERIRTAALPSTAIEWFDLLRPILGIDARDLLVDAADTFFGGDDALSDLVAALDGSLAGAALTYPSDAAVDPVESVLAQLSAIDSDPGTLLVQHLIAEIESDPALQLVRLARLLERWTGTVDPAEVVAFFVPEFEVTVAQVAMAIELPRAWMVPVDEGGAELPPPTRARLIADAGRLAFSSRRGVSLGSPGGFTLERASLLGTGLTVEVRGAMPALGVGPLPPAAAADGRPDDFVGFVIEEAAVGLPVGWLADDGASTAEIFARDVVLGTGGVSATVGLRARDAAPGGPQRLRLALGGPSGIVLELGHVDLAVHHNEVIRSTFEGGLSLPGLSGPDGSPSTLTVHAALDADGGFVVATTGEVYLGPNVRLGPVGDQPILRTELAGGIFDRASFAVHGLLSLPHPGEASGLRAVQLDGELVVARAADGEWGVESIVAAGTASGLSWTLPGGIILQEFEAGVTWSPDGGFAAHIGGAVDLESGGRIAVAATVALPDPADPAHLVLHGSVSATGLDLAGSIHIIDGTATLHVATRPTPAGTLTLSGTCGLLSPATGAPAPGVEDFDLAIDGLDARFMFDPGGVALTVGAGTLLLPEALGPGPPPGSAPGTPAARPTATITPDAPITAYLSAGGGSFSGAVLVAGLSFAIEDVLHAHLATARLTFSSTALPRLTEVAGSLTVPITDDEDLVLVLSDGELALDGIPIGRVALAETIDLPLGGGFVLRVVGGTAAAGDAGIATGLTVTRDGASITARIDASLLLVAPAAALALEDGGELMIGGAGHVILTADGAPVLHVEHAVAGGSFRLGGADGLQVRDGFVTAFGLEHLLAPTAATPVVVEVTGILELPNGGPGLGLRGARFVFASVGPPSFDIEGLDVIPGEVLSAGDVLPVTLESASLTFREPLPFPDRLAPSNLVILLTGEVMLPLSGDGGIGGRVEDLEITFDEAGVPQLSIDGIALEITGVDLGVLQIGGHLYIGGLSDLADPSGLYFAGRVGGTLNDIGVEVLAAFRLSGPIGACLDVSLGPAGIPLGQTGILLTGIAGGVSFTNTGGDPCDFRSYVQLDAAGRPMDAAGATDGAADPPVHDPHADPPGGPAAVPPDEALAFPAPAEQCPPPSMNILAEPHPDRARHPDAVIYRFSAIDRETLESLGITRELVAGWGLTSPAAMAGNFATRMRSGIASLWPAVPAGLEAVHEARAAALDAIETAVAALAEPALAAALDAAGDADDVYEAIVALAWAGIPVQDVTVKLTGTFSYLGVSLYLSVTGGIVLSTTGSAGIVGSLNLMGIPIGTFRGFVIATDAEGLPNPSLCGEVKAAVGPLSLGVLRMSMTCPGGVTGIAGAVVRFAGRLATPVVADAIGRVAPRLLAEPGYDPAHPHAALPLLTTGEAAGLVAHVLSRPPADADGFLDALVELLDEVWESFQPEILLAGTVQPKLFGLPLAGEVVGVSAFASKTELAGQFRFSPSFVIGYFLGGLLPPFDQATLGFRVALPDPADTLRAGLTGAFTSTAELVEAMEGGLEHVLANATFTVSYTIAPLGLEMADAQARIVLPLLDDHPDAAGASPWHPPEERPGNLPGRSLILQAALEANVLGNPLWRGTPAELAVLDVGEYDPPTGLDLRRDYFPHGGFVGAGHLAMPRLLVDPPPFELLEVVADARGQLLERAAALVELVTDWVLTTVDIGTLAFAMPCASLPTASQNLRDATAAVAGAPLPDDPAGIFPLEHAFFRGSVAGRLIGIPIGNAEVEAVGADEAAGEPAYLLIRGTIPDDSWLAGFVGEASIELVVAGTPGQAVNERFADLVETLPAPPPHDPDAARDPTRAGKGRPLAAQELTPLTKVRGAAEWLERMDRRRDAGKAEAATSRERSGIRESPTRDPSPGPRQPERRMREVPARVTPGAPRDVVGPREARLPIDLAARAPAARDEVPRPRDPQGGPRRAVRDPFGRRVDAARLGRHPATGDHQAAERRPARDDASTVKRPVPDPAGSLTRTSRAEALPGRRPAPPRPPTAGHVEGVVEHGIDALALDLPKVSLLLAVSDLRIPDELAFLLGVTSSAAAELQAFSLAYDPSHPGDRAVDVARRNGGIVVTGRLNIGTHFGIHIDVPHAELVIVAGAAAFPDLSVDLDVTRVVLPGGLPALADVSLDLFVPGGSAGFDVAGVTCRLEGRLFGVATALSLGEAGGERRFSAQLDLEPSIEVTIGPLLDPFTASVVVVHQLHLDTTMDLTLEIDLRPSGASIQGQGTFTWNGSTWALPPTALQGPMAGPAQLAARVGEAIASQASGIFAALLESADEWARAVHNGAIVFAGSLAAALRDIYELAATGTADLLAGLGWSSGQVADALADAGYDWADVAAALDATFALTASGLAELLADAGAGWSAVADALADLFALDADDFAAAMADAGFSADQVAAALRREVTSSANSAAGALRGAGFTATQVAQGLYDHFTTSVTTGGEALVAAGYSAATVARCLQAVFAATASEVTAFLASAFTLSMTAIAAIVADVFADGG